MREHALILLKSLLSFGESRGLCTPQRITLKPKASRRVQNFLKVRELKKLDAALVALVREEPENVLAYAALRLLLATGLRKMEVLSLEWSMIDLEHAVIHLPRHKGSDEGRDVLLSDGAVEVLKSIPRLARGGWVFFGRSRTGHLWDVNLDLWRRALKRAGLRYVRIHDLRHSFASAAIGSGTSLFVTGKLLGHRQSRTTERYAHLAREAEREAVHRVANLLA